MAPIKPLAATPAKRAASSERRGNWQETHEATHSAVVIGRINIRTKEANKGFATVAPATAGLNE